MPDPLDDPLADPLPDRAAEPPPTRWARLSDGESPYAESFARLVATGQDVDGEARLADALVPRGARVLDVGSGMGRVSAALSARGHDVVAVEPDRTLVAQSRATYPDLEVLPLDALHVTPALGAFDLVVLVGNVIVYVADGTERSVLAGVRAVLAEGGRVLVGFHLTARPRGARHYPPEEFVADAEASGLVVQHRFGSYEMHPPNDEYAVWVLTTAGR